MESKNGGKGARKALKLVNKSAVMAADKEVNSIVSVEQFEAEKKCISELLDLLKQMLPHEKSHTGNIVDDLINGLK